MSETDKAVAGRAKTVRSPEDISRDVRGVKLRQRVSLTFDDDIPRDDLEEFILERANLSASQVNVRAYQDVVIPAGEVKPISDIRGADTLNYSKVERLTRCKLAAMYRLMNVLNWGEGIFDHMMCTVQMSEDDTSILVGPHGLLFSEITASSLLVVNGEGEVTKKGSTNLGAYRPVLALHLAIHAARKDAKCVLFINTDTVKGVAATKAGLLPISHDAIAIGEVSYHNFPGFVLTDDVKESLGNELGPSNKVMILCNFGAICVGDTVEETFHTAFFFVKACENQVQAIRLGLKNLLTVDMKAQGQMLHALEDDADGNIKKQKQAIAHFEVWMRWLDCKGYKTDYNYSNPGVFKNQKAHSPAKEASSRKPDREGRLPRRSKSLGRASDYRSRANWSNSPVKATQYWHEISEPEMNELDFDFKNWDQENNEVEKHEKSISEPGFEQEVFVAPNVIEEVHATPDFDISGADNGDKEPGHVAAGVMVTPERAPDVSPQEGELVRRRSGKKVKKRRSFREKLMHRISTG